MTITVEMQRWRKKLKSLFTTVCMASSNENEDSKNTTAYAVLPTRNPLATVPMTRATKLHHVALRVQACKSIITTQIYFVANSDMQLKSYKALPAQNSFRKCRSRSAIVYTQPLSCRRPSTANVLCDPVLMAEDGRVGEGGMELSKYALQPLYFL